MAYKYFGTDGIRGHAGQGTITPEFMLKLAQAAASVVANGINNQPAVLIGKDTRLGGYMLESALQAGFTSMGWTVLLVGPMPTAAVAMLTRSLRAQLGIMITASHNPYHDDGVKIFDAQGCKLHPELIHKIEAAIDDVESLPRATDQHIGRARRLDDAAGRYMETCKQSVPKDFSLHGTKIVVDCAHGAAYKMAPKILWELGAEVKRIGCEPNGLNINNHFGATDPANLQQAVVDQQADIGFALDGDADRIVAVDENGDLLDGDILLAAMATYYKNTNQLRGGVVGTIMTNTGMEQYLKSQDITLHRAAVGDHNVAMAMQERDCNLGGEPNGHLIFNDFAPMGDSILGTLQIMAALKDMGVAASDLQTLYTPTVQLLDAVTFDRGVNRAAILEDASIQSQIGTLEAELGEAGRTVIRPSGTEPVIRVMAEGADEKKVRQVVKQICAVIENAAASNAA